MADVTIDPGRVGRVNALIRVLRDDFSEFPASQVSLNLDAPAPGLQPVSRTAVYQSDGSWRVNDIDLPHAGNWTVRVTVGSNSGDKSIVLDAPIVIEQGK
jgi:copper transport protein